MTWRLALHLAAAAMVTSGSLGAQTIEHRHPVVQEIVDGISADSIQRIVERLAAFHTRHTLSDTTDHETGIGAARRWIKSELEAYSRASGGRLNVEYHRFIAGPQPRIPEPTEIVNVVATLPGRLRGEDERVYVVSGHYDSRVSDIMDAESFSPGANDDASGTAVVMELARVMSRYEFDATFVFMAVAGEEQGLTGARQWAQDRYREEMNIQGMITNDIVGNIFGGNGIIDNTRVRVFSEGVSATATDEELRRIVATGGENDSPSRQFARYIQETSPRYTEHFEVVMIYRRDRYLRGGDHIPFNELGYPAVRFTEMNENYNWQHQDVRFEGGIQYGDLPEFVDYEYAANVARMNAAALASLGMAPPPPIDAGIDISELDHDTALTWKHSGAGDLAGFYICIRETTAPQWQRKIFIDAQSARSGDGYRYVAEGISKDNFIFGIQAAGGNGLHSVTVFPHPVR
jgi:acetylornithine deacetylase/succinyl-diaminopimelate desuccinylase-like protein